MIDPTRWPAPVREALDQLAVETQRPVDALVLDMVTGMLAVWRRPDVVTAPLVVAAPVVVPVPVPTTELARVRETVALIGAPVAALQATHHYNARYPQHRIGPMRMASTLSGLTRRGLLQRVDKGRYTAVAA